MKLLEQTINQSMNQSINESINEAQNLFNRQICSKQHEFQTILRAPLQFQPQSNDNSKCLISKLIEVYLTQVLEYCLQMVADNNEILAKEKSHTELNKTLSGSIRWIC
jgi:hypothetical protein